jgi:predicted heme/steroid binding protein
MSLFALRNCQKTLPRRFRQSTCNPTVIRSMATLFTLDECQQRDGANGRDLWVVVESHVLDITSFFLQHPGSARKIVDKRKESGVDITRNFVDHFSHTVQAFRKACQEYDQVGAPVKLVFQEAADAPVFVIGKIQR